MSRILHISANVFGPLNEDTHTRKIWVELAKGFKQYHVLGRSQDNLFHTHNEGNIYLHLVPHGGHTCSFIFTSLYAFIIVPRYSIDLCLVQCPIFGGLTAAVIDKLYKIPYMQEIHDTFYFDILRSHRLLHMLLGKIIMISLNHAKKIRALNGMMATMILEIAPNAKIAIIPNRVNLAIFKHRKTSHKIGEQTTIISIGSLVKRKGYHIAISAIIKLRTHYHLNIRLLLIGDGPEKSKLQELAFEQCDVEFVGDLPQETISEILSNADIYIQPSLREGMPRALLEAMAVKLPLITTNVGTIPGVIHDMKNGMLISPGSVDEMVEALLVLVRDQDLRESLAINAYNDIVGFYEWDRSFVKYRAELLDILDI